MTSRRSDTMGGRHFPVRPQSSFGRWCLGLMGMGVLGYVAMMVSVGLGQEGGETFTDNWWISGPALVAASGVVGSFVTGLIAILAKHERAFAVLIATAIGALATFFLLGELITPH